MDIHEEQFKNFFGPGRAVHPRESFREKSLTAILLERQEAPSLLATIRHEFLENIKFGFALGLAAVFIFLVSGGISNWERFIPGNAERANEELLSEAASLDFQIQLGEAEYFTHSADDIALMIKSLKDGGGSKSDVDVLLNKIIF